MAKTLVGSPVRKSSHPLPDHNQDWAWINEHLDNLRGRWVVMNDGKLVASNPDIRQLLDKLLRNAYPNAMVTYVPTEDEAGRVVL